MSLQVFSNHLWESSWGNVFNFLRFFLLKLLCLCTQTWHRLRTGYVFTTYAQPLTQGSTLSAVQNYFGPRPQTPYPHSSKLSIVDEPYSFYDPWDETNEQKFEHLYNETYQDYNSATTSNCDSRQKNLNIPGCEQFEKQFVNHEFIHEQHDSFSQSCDHIHYSDLPNTSIITTPLPYVSHLEKRIFSDPGVCDPDGGGGDSLLWQSSSRQNSFSQPSVSAPVVESHSTWEPSRSQSSLASLTQQPDIQLLDAGLAAALASVTLGAPLMAEQSALEEHLRRQGWEQGNIDYMGKDSFSNIWQKICDTLATGSQPSATEAPTPSASEVSTTPVAPVAAPVFVSSVEMSPSGPIDTSPPASYVPVSSSKPTDVDSETEATSKAASAETATVVLEPKSSVTEVISTEAIVTSSASVDTSAHLDPATTGETPATPAPTLPAVDTTRAEQTPESLTSSQASAEETVPKSLPLTGTLEAQVLPGTVVEVSTPILQKTDILASSPSGAAETPAPLKSETTEKSDTPLVLVEVKTSPEKPTEVVPTPAAIVPTEIVVPAVSAEAVQASAGVKLSDILTSTVPTEAVVTPTVEILTSVTSPATPAEPISTPDKKTTDSSASIPSVGSSPGVVPTESPTPSTQPDSVLTKTEAIPVDSVAPAIPLASGPPIVTSAIALPAVSTSMSIIETPIPIPTEATPISESQFPVEVPSVLASSDVPQVPLKIEPDVSKTVEIPKDVPIAVSSTQTIEGSTELKAADIPAPIQSIPEQPQTPTVTDIPAPIQSTPEQPQTPTVTEPTPPTSPPVAPVESPLVTKLQVETEVPATPPVESGASQPSLASASTGEPPVPPKRKGSSKASQETKSQKGGKQQSKGKK